jgi:hypothetical protein
VVAPVAVQEDSVRQLTIGLAIVALLGMPTAARAQAGPDETSLKLAHETVIKAVTSGNLAVVQGMIHPRASGFFRDSQQLVQLSPTVTAAAVLPTLIADLGTFASIATTDTGYRIFGAIGIVNMTAFEKRKPSERGSDRYLRGSYVYLWEAGNWKLISWHGSDTPLKK